MEEGVGLISRCLQHRLDVGPTYRLIFSYLSCGSFWAIAGATFIQQPLYCQPR